MKTCFKCGKEKSLSDFYLSKSNKDGLTGSCKECIKAHTAKKYKESTKDPEKKFVMNSYWAEYRTKRRKRISRRESYLAQKTHRKKYPEKYAATIAMSHLSKQRGMHFHHWSYNDEHQKDVICLTPKDHRNVHRYIIYDSKAKMYRRLDGVLLNTREASEAYYKHVLSLHRHEFPRFAELGSPSGGCP